MNDFTSEFLGTAILVFLGKAVTANAMLSRTKGQGSSYAAVAAGCGLAMFVAGWAAVRSGAHLNPAVTLALAAYGRLPAADIPTYLSAQFLGALVGAALVAVQFLPHWRATEDPERVRAALVAVPGIRAPLSNLLAEAGATFAWVLAVLCMVLNPWAQDASSAMPGLGAAMTGSEQHAMWFIAAMSLAFTAVCLGPGGPIGVAINPARDLCSRVVHAVLPLPSKGSSDWGYAWIPVVGPLLGAMAALQTARWIGIA